MKRWLLIATDGDSLMDLGRAEILAFESRGEDRDANDDSPLRPARVDLEAAAKALAERSEIPIEKIERLRVTLVPLEDAEKLELTIGVRAELSARVGGGV